MAAMFDKYNSYVYGSCPLLDCHAQNQAVLPIGTADQLMTAGTKVFCPRCQEIFHPKSSRLETLDGAYFGTSFPHVFLLTYPHLVPQSPPRIYIPRIYGFRVSKKVKENMRKRVGYVPKSSQPNNNQASNQQISSSTSSKKILDGQMQNKGGQTVQ